MRVLPNSTDFYQIEGSDIQVVKINLQPDQSVVAEAGNLFYMDGNVNMETKAGGKGILGAIGGILKRKIVGESALLTEFSGEGIVAFSSDKMGKIVPILLEDDSVYAQKDAFLCGIGDISIDIAMQKRFMGGLFGGEGFVLEKLSGEGVVFISATGYLEVRKLQNETLLVETSKAVAWSEGIDYGVETVRDIKTAIFGGEGLFLTRLSGSGIVVLQSVDFETLVRKIIGVKEDED